MAKGRISLDPPEGGTPNKNSVKLRLGRPVGGSAIAIWGIAKVKPRLEKITNPDP